MESYNENNGRAAFAEYRWARYIIMFVAVFLAAVLAGAFLSKMLYSSFDMNVTVLPQKGTIHVGDARKLVISAVSAEASTVIELLLIAVACATKVPSLFISSVIMFRGLSLGWCTAYLVFSTELAVVGALIGYTIATVIMIFFSAESTAFTKENKFDIISLGHYTAGFLTMSAGVFIAELVPLIIFAS